MPIVLGIDFGTSNSCISYFDGSNYNILTNEYGKYTTPSCVYFNPTTDEILYGETAYVSLKNPCNIIYNIKRLLGITYSEFKNNKELEYFFRHLHVVKDPKSEYCCVKVTYNNVVQTFSIEYICKIFIQNLISYAQTHLNHPVQSAVITVPVKFSHIQRTIIKQIFQDININVLRILNEPTAASLAYIHNNDNNDNKYNNDTNLKNILVIDCGGGTTDFTVLESDYSEMFFQVKQTLGDSFLGGEDITNNLLNYVLSKSNVCFTTRQIDKIRKLCETCKCNLSFTTQESIDECNKFIQISRPQFVSINQDFFNKIKQYLYQITFDIDKVILVGGTTRIPHFIKIVKDVFGHDIIIQNSLNPDHTISIGAARQGYLLTNEIKSTQLDVTFLDITSMSLGIETIGGIMTPIISKGSILPISKTQNFTKSDSDNEIDIRIFQGERRLVKDNLFLGSFNITTLSKNHSIIQVTFDINSDGILIITAKEKSQSTEKTLVITDYLKQLNETYTYSDEFEKIQDSEMSNKILAKIELNNIYQTFIRNYQNFKHIRLTELLNTISDIITNFEDYTTEYLIEYKKTFQEQWHTTCINLT
jgi:heat shock 70kDa protein 1/2/6/8